MRKILLSDRPKGFLWSKSASHGNRYHIWDTTHTDPYLSYALCGMPCGTSSKDDEFWDDLFDGSRECNFFCCPDCVSISKGVGEMSPVDGDDRLFEPCEICGAPVGEPCQMEGEVPDASA